MQLLIDIIKIVLLVLIKIGDAVLFLLSLIVGFLGKAQKTFEKKIQQTTKSYLRFYKNIGKSIEAVFLRLARRIKFQRKSTKIKKNKRVKPVVIFPFPAMLKLKYFAAGVLFSLVFIFFPLLFLSIIQDLPSPQELTSRQIPQTTKIYDRNGVLLYQIYAAQDRTLVGLSDIPKYLKNATITIEDKDFYKHPGVDVSAIIRSFLTNLSGRQLQGGSTITQQLIKSALLSPETSIRRKIKEVVLAFWAERIYTKNQILEMYFNQVPYGGTAWGAESAAQVYFNKRVKDLDLAQSAFLAGIPRAPSIYSPFGTTPTLWKKRQKEVLGRMANFGYITGDQAKSAAEEELFFQSPQIPIHAPHFVMYIKDFLVKKYGLPIVEKGGLSVVTSLDLKKQEETQEIVAEEVGNNSYLNLTNGAALVTNPKNGDILIMVGSKDYEDPTSGNVNLATAIRQPGSAIKIVTYSAALSNGFTAATVLDDSPISFTSAGSPSYSPVNYDGKFHGRVPLRIAFANSFNIPAVKTLNQIGVQNMVDLGKRMGIKTWSDPNNYGLSITLGGADVTMLDMATVYGTVANGGNRVNLNPILKITDYKNNVLEEKGDAAGIRVLDRGVAFIISSILADNQARAWEFGTNSPLNIAGRTVSVKTGTSDNKRDNWTIGYTPSYVVTVWVGNNDNSPMSQNLASGITGAAPIWNRIMTGLLRNSSDEKLSMPSSVVVKFCLGRNEYFIRGTENSVNCAPLPSSTPTPTP